MCSCIHTTDNHPKQTTYVELRGPVDVDGEAHQVFTVLVLILELHLKGYMCV